MGLPAKYPLAIYRGDTFRIAFRLWKDRDKTEPVDLTDIDVKAEVRDKPSGLNITLMSTTVELPNLIEMEMSAVTTGTLPAIGAWDLQLTYASGDVTTILAGGVTVTPDVTDSTRSIAAVSYAARSSA